MLLFVVLVSEFSSVVLTEGGTVDLTYKSRGNFTNNYRGEDDLWSREGGGPDCIRQCLSVYR